MANAQEFIDAITEIQEERKLSFAELIAKVWNDKVVEVYIGDTYEDLSFEDSSQKIPAVIIGKVITAYRECLVMDCAYIDQRTKKMLFGNVICLNERGIRHITEVDDSGVLRDTFLSSKDAKMVKDLLTGK